jgi:uncharacterized phage protein (TIGR02218 family)
MKSASANLITHIGQSTTTLSTLVHVTRTDGVEFFFTDADADIVYGGDTYAASSAATRSNIASDASLSTNNSELSGPVLDSPDITEADLMAGVFDHARVEIMLINREAVADGVIQLPGTVLGEVTVNNGAYNVEVRGLAQYLQQSVGRVAMKRCDASLGDTRCGASLASHTVTGTVSSFTNRQTFVVTTPPATAGGLLTWTSGNNSGLSMEARALSGSTITLFGPMPYDIQIGDGYSAHRGCDKNLSTCRDTFTNVARHRGLPFIVGQDEMNRS